MELQFTKFQSILAGLVDLPGLFDRIQYKMENWLSIRFLMQSLLAGLLISFNLWILLWLG